MRYLLAILVALLPLGAVAQSGGGGPVGAGAAGTTGYTPDDGGNWTDPDPTTVAGALDALAAAAAGVITAALQDLDDVGVVGAADRWLYSTGAGVWAYGTVTAAGRAILDDATAGDQRTTLGLGALATGADTTDVPIAACAVDANWDSSICPAAAQTAFDELASRVTTLEGAGGGGAADAVTKDISQATHGLSVGDWVRLSGGSYVEAQANSAANAEVVGVVSAVDDVNTFTLQVAGRVTGLSGLTANAVHYLDASTAGAITATEPTGSNVSKPVLIADSTTSGWVLQMRGTLSQASGGWDWAQTVASPAASDWADASAAGADVSMTAISDGTVGDYVILNPGTSTTEQYGVTMAAAAGDWVWCARIDRMTDSGAGAVTTATLSMDFVLVAAFVDGTDLDNSTWNGAGLIGGAQDWNGSDIGTVSGPGSGSDRWDGALVAGEVQDFMGWSTADVCLERSGTTLVAWIGQRAGGMQRADSWTVSADAGLYAIVLRDTDANHHHRVRLPAYGLLDAVPGME